MTEQQFLSLKKRSDVFRNDTYSLRIDKVKRIISWIEKNEEDIYDALKSDFNKPQFETLISEIGPCLTEARYVVKNLKSWMKDQKVKTPLVLFGHQSFIRYENKGVVLIIAPWNFPFLLSIVPLISAIAAGNTVVIKPSELTPATSKIIKKLSEDCFYANEVLVEEGSKEKTTELLQFKFDHVFFTGSTHVGKIIAQSCASRLIPVTLELGGKSPTIIDETANITEAAEKIFWGKYFNRSQACVAPDYLIIHHSVVEEFKSKFNQLVLINKDSEKANIITKNHEQRLLKMVDGPYDFNTQVALLFEVKSLNHPSMIEEIFGPLLPYFVYSQQDEISQYVDSNIKPLSFYVFSHNKTFIDTLLKKYSSGSVGINSVIAQFGNHYLPFGGVGNSGYGSNHGFYGYSELSHRRSIIKRQYFWYLAKLFLPPYTDFKTKLMHKLISITTK